MTQYVALFRGINVGGKNIVPMKELRELLAGLDCENVATYIQSGNAVFTSESNGDDLSRSIAGVVNQQFGFEPQVLVLTADAEAAAAVSGAAVKLAGNRPVGVIAATSPTRSARLLKLLPAHVVVGGRHFLTVPVHRPQRLARHLDAPAVRSLQPHHQP